VDVGRPGDLALELKSHLDGDFLVEWGEVHGHDARDDALGGVPRRWRARCHDIRIRNPCFSIVST
jgi:hypothetical protein